MIPLQVLLNHNEHEGYYEGHNGASAVIRRNVFEYEMTEDKSQGFPDVSRDLVGDAMTEASEGW